mmetsp:Transcript_48795/g.98381  ORF Transcript_48795/g.98381 Transcript_48795/m.98381 type:complete len:353 (-) Transcript_48795:20-1078(-)
MWLPAESLPSHASTTVHAMLPGTRKLDARRGFPGLPAAALTAALVDRGLRPRRCQQARAWRSPKATCARCRASADSASSTQRFQALAHQGFLRVSGAVPPEASQTLLNLLWEDYGKRYGVSRTDPTGWSTSKGQDMRLYGPLPKALLGSSRFDALTARLRALGDDLFGSGSWRLRRKATMFVNCPSPSGTWVMPAGWHTDVLVEPGDPMPSFVYAFAFLDHAEPYGGNTLLLSGSTRRLRLMDRAVRRGGQLLKEALACDDELLARLFALSEDGEDEPEAAQRAADTAQLMEEGVVSAGIPMRVVELRGAPTDLLIWDPRSLHTASGNVSSRPRSVIRFRLELSGASPHGVW